MNEQITRGIQEGRVILFLGAGASIGSRNSEQLDPPLAADLAKTIAEKAGWTYSNEQLGTVYAAAKTVLGTELDRLLVNKYLHCKPSSEYLSIAKFPWTRIYTTNIDDALEKALEENSQQKVNVKNRNDRIEDKDQLFSRVEYIYLNGSVKRPDTGFVFSPEEYGKASASRPQWYEEVASDFLQCTFVFIGTSLDEPTLYHQIERYKERAGVSAPKSYVITPHATPIQIASLESYGLSHIAGSVNTFANWLDNNFIPIPSPLDIAKTRFPELAMLLDKTSSEDQAEKAELFKDVLSINRQNLSVRSRDSNTGTVRQFYKGFKPTWIDVMDGVPATLKQFASFESQILNAKNNGHKMIALIGPAGSGKSTMLKMTSLKISEQGKKVYSLSTAPDRIERVLYELEKANNDSFYVFIDRIDPIKNELRKVLDSLNKSIIVSAESQNIWHNRLESKYKLQIVCTYSINEIDEEDVVPLLDKLRTFGPWTRLGTMSDKARRREIFERSKRQLLIGLMESTTGVGFEQIIQKDYESIASEADKFFFVLVCIATMHRCHLSSSIGSRSLTDAGITESPAAIASRLKGLIDHQGTNFVARHPVYARKIMESVVDRALISNVIKSILSGFSVYQHPVVANLNKNDSSFFKAVINHRFLADVLRNDERVIFSIYSSQEKSFESDGLYWLQYGLSKRDFGYHLDAFELFQTAHNAYAHEHTTHALAQQKLILASSNHISPEQARNHLQEAIELLESLDHTLQSDDTYPIVTLAEGHVKALRALDGEIARVKAREYIDRIDSRLRGFKDQRLIDSKAKLLTYATTGNWSE
ncbi:MAG: SIR2 family protein [Gammaproteobacteria bacterium]|nr:SIR2 family protein [Pseudomonadales bacterium]